MTIVANKFQFASLPHVTHVSYELYHQEATQGKVQTYNNNNLVRQRIRLYCHCVRRLFEKKNEFMSIVAV